MKSTYLDAQVDVALRLGELDGQQIDGLVLEALDFVQNGSLLEKRLGNAVTDQRQVVLNQLECVVELRRERERE